MSLPGIRPRGKKGEAPDKGAIHSPSRIKTNTHTPRRRVAGKGGENGQSLAGGQDHRCAYPQTLHSSPHAQGLQQGAGVPVGSHRTTPELGISTVLLRRPVAAGAFLLGPPEGGVSELESLPAASQSRSNLVQAAITAVPGWDKRARISKYFDLPKLGGSIQLKRQGGRHGA